MKLMELLTGQTSPTPNPMQSPTAAMVNPQAAMTPPSTTPPQPPMQTAGMFDKLSNFITTPQPIGNQTPQPNAPPTAAAQAITNATPFGAVNQALQGANTAANKPPQQ